MDASFSSTTSTCSSTSNSTIMGPPTVVPSLQDEEEYPVAMTLHDQAQSPAEAQDAGESAELRYMRMAEEELNRIRTIPTPSNSPVLEMRMVAAVFGSENGNGGSGNSTSTSNSANTSTGTTTPTGSTATGTTSPPPSEMSGVKGGGSVAANPWDPRLAAEPHIFDLVLRIPAHLVASTSTRAANPQPSR
ncbi:hypothetical protein NLJ89_g12434 [Agrocybe chaxingu]|uniref:Uncharacterized protein n=1 Tax=Agrocybe chaxingu TaxID=84603 RepID=A0A9W8MM57_9AGAR|nr:hypothetical protein NLJ89_g12434 [Agrocybe chaxingu]